MSNERNTNGLNENYRNNYDGHGNEEEQGDIHDVDGSSYGNITDSTMEHGYYLSGGKIERNNLTDDTSINVNKEEPKQEKDSWIKKSQVLLTLYGITSVMILARSIDFVLYIRMSHKMENYVYILADILLSFGFICVSWPVVWFKMFVTGEITKEMRQFPNYKFVLMGIFDSLNVLISTIPAAMVSGPINVIMGQSVVLVNFFASFLFLRSRYNLFHVVGLTLVIAGIGVKIFPALLGDSEGGAWFWILLLFVANIPMAASNVYKEKYLKSAKLDVWYMNAWVAFYQLVFGIISFPIVFIPPPPGSHGSYIKPSEFPQYFMGGLKCFIGINTITEGPVIDKCDYFYIVFIIFLAFNMTFNILMLVVFQRASSTLAMIASAARLVLSNFGFLIPFLAGEAYDNNVVWNDFVALFLLISGIFAYGATKEKEASEGDILVKIEKKITDRMSCDKVTRPPNEPSNGQVMKEERTKLLKQ